MNVKLRLKRFLDRQTSVAGIPGISITVRHRDDEYTLSTGALNSRSGNPVTPTTKFDVSCFGKLLVSLAALQLSERGLLELGAPITRYLPDISHHRGAHLITVNHLMSHVSGYRGKISYVGIDSWSDAVTFFNQTPQLFPPGQVYSDERFDHMLLGEIVTRVSGMNVFDFVNEEFFGPLGIKAGQVPCCHSDTGVIGHRFNSHTHEFEVADYQEDAPVRRPAVSNLTLSTEAIATVGAALMGFNVRAAENPFSGYVRQAIQSLEIAVPAAVSVRLQAGWTMIGFGKGFAKFANGQLGVFFGGRGQTGALILLPESQTVLSLAFNIQSGPFRSLLLSDLLCVLRGDVSDRAVEPAARNLSEVKYDDFLAGFRPEEITGSYMGPLDRPLIVRARSGRVDVCLGEEPHFVICRLEKGGLKLVAKDGVPIAIFKDPAGAPAILVGMQAYKKMNRSNDPAGGKRSFVFN